METLRKDIALFLNDPDQGEYLQNLLMEHNERSTSLDESRNGDGANSWIASFWNDMYLNGRWPLFLNSNPGGLAINSQFQWLYDLGQRTGQRPSTISSAVASIWILAVCEFISKIKTQTLKPDLIGKKKIPLDMSSYFRMFQSTRIPKKGRDVLVGGISSEIIADDNNNLNFIAVSRKGLWFKLELPNHEIPESQIANVAEAITVALEEIREMADKEDERNRKEKVGMSSTAFPLQRIAYLTTLERNTWAKERERILSTDTRNAESFDVIDKSLFHLNLDDAVGTEPSRADLVGNGLHGGTPLNRRNRWWDKSITLSVDESKDAKCFFSFEHSWGDGIPVLRQIADVFHDVSKRPIYRDFDFNNVTSKTANTISSSNNIPVRWSKLNFNLSDETVAVINEAAKVADKLADEDLSLEVLEYKTFGTRDAKLFGFSPDGLCQQALQLTYRQLHHCTVNTYESASTQAYKGGRTETLRSVSRESRAFVDAMDECGCLDILPFEEKNENGKNTNIPPTDLSILHSLLKAACEKHSKLGKEAASGQGFDRHFYALKCLATLDNDQANANDDQAIASDDQAIASDDRATANDVTRALPPLFTSKAFALLESNVLSTSALAADYTDQTAFGPVTSDGYGIMYHAKDDRLDFAVTTYRDIEGTRCSQRFCHYLKQNLDIVFQIAQSQNHR
eukprot:g2896.t1